MPIGDHSSRDFQPGQVARIGVELADVTGIKHASMTATNTGEPVSGQERIITLAAYGQGTTGELIFENSASRALSPAVIFTVSHPPGLDVDAPTAGDWGFANTGELSASGATVVPNNIEALS